MNKLVHEDYAELSAHYQMLLDAGNRELKIAQAKSAQAHEYFEEAERIHEQLQQLERLMRPKRHPLHELMKL